MIQKDLNEEYKEIKSKAYELYEKHGFKDGNDFVDWLEAERQTGKRSRLNRPAQSRYVLFAILGVLCFIAGILLFMLFRYPPQMVLSAQRPSDLKVMMSTPDQKADEEVVAFGDTHFGYNQSALTNEAKTLLDREVQLLNENPDMKVRMAGYTSAKGTEESNQKLSERRANAVRDFLIKKGIAPGRISTIGYGRTKPALFELSPGNINSREARANMRVLFEIMVK